MYRHNFIRLLISSNIFESQNKHLKPSGLAAHLSELTQVAYSSFWQKPALHGADLLDLGQLLAQQTQVSPFSERFSTFALICYVLFPPCQVFSPVQHCPSNCFWKHKRTSLLCPTPQHQTSNYAKLPKCRSAPAAATSPRPSNHKSNKPWHCCSLQFAHPANAASPVLNSWMGGRAHCIFRARFDVIQPVFGAPLGAVLPPNFHIQCYCFYCCPCLFCWN